MHQSLCKSALFACAIPPNVQQHFRRIPQVVDYQCGGVAEWLNAAVLKTVRPVRVSGVRIPPPPPLNSKEHWCYEDFALIQSARFFCCLSQFISMVPKTVSSGVPITLRRQSRCTSHERRCSYCSFAYSALACFRMGMSGSASFQRVRKS